MRLLLDTHAPIWALAEPEHLSRDAQHLLSEEAEVWVSAVTLWEIAARHALGRLPISARRAHDACLTSGFRLLPLTSAHTLLLPDLPFRPDHRGPDHRDPDHRDAFDRMLLVQAMGEGLTLMTTDRKLAACGVPTIGCT